MKTDRVEERGRLEGKCSEYANVRTTFCLGKGKEMREGVNLPHDCLKILAALETICTPF